MDPNSNLKMQLDIAKRLLGYPKSYVGQDPSVDRTFDAEQLACLVQDLDKWLSGGGFLPKSWEDG